jgi:hypothetical protein
MSSNAGPPPPPEPYTPAAALASAQELKRYLDLWHVNSAFEPQEWLADAEARMREGYTFRHVVATAAHDLHDPARPVVETWTLYNEAERAERAESDPDPFVGMMVQTVPPPPSRSQSLWLLREFRERIAPHRSDPRWEYLWRIFDGLLDELAYRWRWPTSRVEAVYLVQAVLERPANPRCRIMTGRRVRPAILTELVRAARDVHDASLLAGIQTTATTEGAAKSERKPSRDAAPLKGSQLEKIIDEDVLAVLESKKVAANIKAQRICDINPGYYMKESTWWGDLLKVSPQAITKTHFWKVVRRKHLRPD